MSKLIIVDSNTRLEELIHGCKTTGYACPDFETTGFKFQNPHDYATILGVSFQPGSSWIIPCGHPESPFIKTYPKLLYKFGKEVIEDPNITKVGWNWKFEKKWFFRYNIVPKGRQLDAMLAKYCLDEERPHDLKAFVSDFFPQYAGYEKEIKIVTDAGELEGVDWKNTPLDKLCKYCGIDCDLTLRGMIIMEPKLIKLGFYSLFRNLLMGILNVLAESEYQGTLADRHYLDKLIKEYAIKIKESDKGLRSVPSLLKFERKYKNYHVRKLIKGVQLEIQQIREDDPPTAPRLIHNRELKIKGYAEGKFNKKEGLRLIEGINLGSPDQMVEFLFKRKFGLRLKPIKFTKDKKTGKYSKTPSTAEDVLKELKKKDKSGFMQKLLDHRGLLKLDSTYISGMYPTLDHNDRIHANFRINGTVTGRLSCVSPNLQNIPRGSTAADIKRQFIAPPGYLLYEFDYSQAELRILAELSGDPALIEIFRKNYNVHVATACKMEGGIHLYEKAKEYKKIGDNMDAKELERPENKKILKGVKAIKKGKSLNFSIVYQQGDKATAEDLGVESWEAKQFKKDWFKEFPLVRKWLNKQKRIIHENESVISLFGRKRRLYDANCGDEYWEAEAERQGINTPIQGASGDYTLFSQVVIREEKLRGNLPRDFMHVYTVHDSLGYYGRPEDAGKIIPTVLKICDNPQTLKYFGFELKHVKMKASAELGLHWAALKDYDPWVDYVELSKNRDAILNIN